MPDEAGRRDGTTTASEATPPRIAELDAIRGIAASVVVVSHVRAALIDVDVASESWLIEMYRTWPFRLLWAGDAAVMVFFVLSGFVLALPFLGSRRPPSWPAFAVKRVIRLYPTYAVTLLLTAGCASLLASGRVFGTIAVHWQQPVTLRWIASEALMVTDYSVVNGAFWSLVHEMRISLVFPALLGATLWLRPAAALPLLTASSLAATFVLTTYPPSGGWASVIETVLKTVFFLTPFAVGIMLAAYRQMLVGLLAGQWRETRLALVILGVGLLGLTLRLPYEAGRLGATFGFALLLPVILATPRACAVLHAPLLQWLGRISYSLYLVHLSVMLTVFNTLPPTVPIGLSVLVSVPLSLIAAWLLWYSVERPSIAWSRRAATWIERRRTVSQTA